MIDPEACKFIAGVLLIEISEQPYTDRFSSVFYSALSPLSSTPMSEFSRVF